MRLYQRYTKIKKLNPAGALLLATITAFVISILIGTLVLCVTNHCGMINREINSTIAFYRAQAGMELAIYQAYTNPATWLPAEGVPSIEHPVTIGGSPVTITITHGGLSNYTFQIKTDYQT